MPAPVTASLIAPDNRLLGWGLTDLTLYGAQPAPAFSVRPADQAATVDPATPLLQPDAAPAAAVDGADARSSADTVPIAEVAPVADAVPTAPTAFQPTVVPTAEPGPSVATPVGSGTAFQPAVATPLQTVADHGHAAAPAPVAASSVSAEPAALAHALSAVPAAATDTVADLATHVLSTPGVDAEALAHDAASPLASIATGLVEALADTPAIAPLAPPVTDAIDAAGIAAHGLIGAAADTVAAATATMGEAHALDGLAGSNPAGGVATLVDMVSTAATFDVGHATSPEVAAAPSILDALAADEAPSSLLGDHHDDAGSAAHAVDPHGIHLGL